MDDLLTNEFLPHGVCLVWEPNLMLLHIISDSLITLAYYSIPLALVYFVAARQDLAYTWMFKLFGAFIFACGTTHLMAIVTLWEPLYWLDGWVKAGTAGVSVATAVLLWPLIPKVLKLPSPSQLEQINKQLRQEIVEREQIQEALQLTHDKLDERVKERTAELQSVNQALRESEEQFRQVVEASPNAIILVGQNGQISLVNAQAEALFGYEREELLGQPVEMLVPPQFRTHHNDYRDGFFSAPTARPMGAGRDLFGLRKDGSQVPVEIGLNPITTTEGNFVLASVIDITERKQAEESLAQSAEELRRSNQELEQFAYVASHDLQEPLRMVISYLQLLERRYADKLDDDGREFIHYAVDGADRMNQLIKDLLAYSRVGTHGKPFEPTNCEMILQQVLNNLELTITDNEAVITHQSLPTVLADDSQLVQLFQNLIGNALKYRGKVSPKIMIDAKLQEGEWLFSVADNGIGIEPEYFDKIFIIFQRLHRRDEYSGTGIGLATCKKIIERHGGRIWVESQPGKGSTFYFTLPVITEKETI